MAGDEGGPLTPAHLLARMLDQMAQMSTKLGAIETQLAVHMESHRVWSRIHRSAYAAFVAALGSLAGLLVSHWR